MELLIAGIFVDEEAKKGYRNFRGEIITDGKGTLTGTFRDNLGTAEIRGCLLGGKLKFTKTCKDGSQFDYKLQSAVAKGEWNVWEGTWTRVINDDTSDSPFGGDVYLMLVPIIK